MELPHSVCSFCGFFNLFLTLREEHKRGEAVRIVYIKEEQCELTSRLTERKSTIQIKPQKYKDVSS